jgi:hypothetical protein
MVHEEVAEAYLKRANLKPLFEWLTAECILSEAKDPLAFCQFLLTQKLEDRGLDKPYDPWVRNSLSVHHMTVATDHSPFTS